MELSSIFGGLAALSAILIGWQWIVGLCFSFRRRTPAPAPFPGISILKPVKGCDDETEGCLRSWFEQDYDGPRQLLFGVASLSDPAVPIIERLIQVYPDRNAALIHCGLSRGTNAKVSTLIQLHERAIHPLICVSDADVWAPPDFIREAAALLRTPGTGLVNSFYRIKRRDGFGHRWEAFATNADFWSQVLQSASLKPLDFALGAAMVFQRDAFEASGGFHPIADHLADDYELGRHLAREGLRIRMSSVVVECRAAPSDFASAWLHQLRWARTIRTCEDQAFPYFLSILGNGTLWPILWWAASPTTATGTIAAGLLALRALQGAILERCLTGRWDVTSLPMSWIKDGLQIAVWLLAFLGRTVWWRDVRYRVNAEGKLTRIG